MHIFNPDDIKIGYKTGRDNIIKDFYLPVLKSSIEYKRAVGYFSSAILVEYISSLKDFYHNGGVMKLIISPNLSKSDIEALKKSEDYVAESNENMKRQLLEYLDEENDIKTASEIFFQLIVNEILEVKIAVPNNKLGIFHVKIGVFYLKGGQGKIAISGSNNETYSSVNTNHESFNTFCSWKPGQLDYMEEHERDFDGYWSNKDPFLQVRVLEKAIVEDVLKERKFTKTIEENYKKLDEELSKKKITEEMSLDFTPYDFQEEAANKLVENGNGILEFATGSEKTKTAIYYMELLKKRNDKNFFLIVVPDKTLLLQWEEEVKKYNQMIVTCYSDSPGWIKKFRDAIDIYKVSQLGNQVVVATQQTMFRQGQKSRFIKQLRHLAGDFSLIVDEVHNWSTKIITDNLPEAKRKVGLSATPFNDEYCLRTRPLVHTLRPLKAR